jgi:hypothetical protein
MVNDLQFQQRGSEIRLPSSIQRSSQRLISVELGRLNVSSWI